MKRHSIPLLLLAFGVTSIFVACGGGDDDPAPSNPTNFQTGGSGGATTGGAGGATTGGAGGATTGGAGGTGGSTGGSGGCATQPKVTEEFLNRCTNSTCAPFDNAARLPLFQGGKLPPIQ